MKKVERNEVLGLGDYEAIRERFRARVIGEKKLRRVRVGEHVSAVFENRDSVLMQVQEMLRTERITREGAIQHEIDTYNELVPGANELSLTLMIEIDDRETRERFLTAAKGFEEHVFVSIDGARIPAKFTPLAIPSDRTTAVHYLKFHVPAPCAERLRAVAEKRMAPKDVEIVLGVSHPAYSEAAPLATNTVEALVEDFVS